MQVWNSLEKSPLEVGKAVGIQGSTILSRHFANRQKRRNGEPFGLAPKCLSLVSWFPILPHTQTVYCSLHIFQSLKTHEYCRFNKCTPYPNRAKTVLLAIFRWLYIFQREMAGRTTDTSPDPPTPPYGLRSSLTCSPSSQMTRLLMWQDQPHKATKMQSCYSGFRVEQCLIGWHCNYYMLKHLI